METASSPGAGPECGDGEALRVFLSRHERLFVLTGAGCSTDSGIPDYRDAEGAWKRQPPVQFPAFMAQPSVRQRSWARSLVGWRHFDAASPNATHQALVRLEAFGRIDGRLRYIRSLWRSGALR